EIHNVLEVDDRASAAHLPQSCDSRLCIQATEVVILICREVRLEERTRTHQRHVAPENIPKLRQLVEAPPAKQCAQSRHARILWNLEQPRIASVIEMRELVLLGICANAHRAELEHSEASAAEPC